MNASQARTAVVRRLLPASAEVVYDEWLDPDALTDWMCPRPAKCLAVASDPRIGGTLRIDICDGQAEFYVTGQYLVLERPTRLAFTWSCSTWADPSLETVVNVLLEPRGPDQTLMTIEHSLLPADLAERHADGWTLIAEQLAAELAAASLRRPTLPS
jgi:uncharacterized protein YndB with AHSA1/START domain